MTAHGNSLLEVEAILVALSNRLEDDEEEELKLDNIVVSTTYEDDMSCLSLDFDSDDESYNDDDTFVSSGADVLDDDDEESVVTTQSEAVNKMNQVRIQANALLELELMRLRGETAESTHKAFVAPQSIPSPSRSNTRSPVPQAARGIDSGLGFRQT